MQKEKLRNLDMNPEVPQHQKRRISVDSMAFFAILLDDRSKLN